MAENKTKPNQLSVDTYLSAIGDETRRSDCRVVADLMSKVTGEPPQMWGAGIVGFGSYHYTYASGREGDDAAVGFSSRKGDISVYLAAGGADQEALLALLGKHKMGKACLYIRKLADIDLGILERLIVDSVADIMRRYPPRF